MIHVCAKIKLQAGKKEDFLNIAADLIKATRKEAGCKYYTLCKGDDDQTFYFAEHWQDKASLDAHFATPHLQNAVATIETIAAAPLQVDIMQIFDI